VVNIDNNEEPSTMEVKVNLDRVTQRTYFLCYLFHILSFFCDEVNADNKEEPKVEEAKVDLGRRITQRAQHLVFLLHMCSYFLDEVGIGNSEEPNIMKVKADLDKRVIQRTQHLSYFFHMWLCFPDGVIDNMGESKTMEVMIDLDRRVTQRVHHLLSFFHIWSFFSEEVNIDNIGEPNVMKAKVDSDRKATQRAHHLLYSIHVFFDEVNIDNNGEPNIMGGKVNNGEPNTMEVKVDMDRGGTQRAHHLLCFFHIWSFVFDEISIDNNEESDFMEVEVVQRAHGITSKPTNRTIPPRLLLHLCFTLFLYLLCATCGLAPAGSSRSTSIKMTIPRVTREKEVIPSQTRRMVRRMGMEFKSDIAGDGPGVQGELKVDAKGVVGYLKEISEERALALNMEVEEMYWGWKGGEAMVPQMPIEGGRGEMKMEWDWDGCVGVEAAVWVDG